MMPLCAQCEEEDPPRGTVSVVGINGAYACAEHMEKAFAALAKAVEKVRDHGN